MKTFDQETVTERFAKLPKEVQDIITSEETNETIRETMSAIGLQGEKKRECIQQITLVAVGFASAGDFTEYVQKELALDNEQATNLETAINNKIFTPIKQSLLHALQNSSQGGSNDRPTNGTMEASASNADPYREPQD